MLTAKYFINKKDREKSEWVFYDNGRQIIRATLYDIWGAGWYRHKKRNVAWEKGVMKAIRREGVLDMRELLTGTRRARPLRDKIPKTEIVKMPEISRLESVE